MAILITGGCGFIGINLAEELGARGERVILFDRNGLPAVTQRVLQKQKLPPQVVTGDVCDSAALERLLKDARVERVIHAAAITAGTAREAAQPGDIVDVNVKGTISVLEAAKAAQCRRVICVSSGSAYGRTLDEAGPLHEDTSPSRPETLYAITKLAAEQIALRLGNLWSLDTICVRLGTVFGPWEFDTGVRDTLSLPLQLIRLAMRGENAVLPRREVRRDWVYSRDVASGLVAALTAGPLPHQLYHLSSGKTWQGAMPAWAEGLKRTYPRFNVEFGKTPNVSYHAERDRALMDIERLVVDTAFRPRFGPTEALEDYAAWIRRHPDFFTASSGSAGT